MTYMSNIICLKKGDKQTPLVLKRLSRYEHFFNLKRL